MKWISVKDRLPGDGEACLIFYKGYNEDGDLETDYLFGVYNHTRKWWENISGMDAPYYKDWDTKYFTHWTPLPKGPDEVD